MIFNIRKFFGLCEHIWEHECTYKVFENDNDRLPIKTYYIQKCSKCGKIDKVKL